MRRLLKIVGILAGLGVAGLLLLLVAMRIEHGRDTTLPQPTGPLAVGRSLYDWTGQPQRELAVWIWYPAQRRAGDTADEYFPASWRAALEQAHGVLLGKILTRDLARVHAHSLRDADLSPQERAYPVVIMRGGASSEVANYSTLAEDLASHGYIVVGFDAPYRTNVTVFPDGRVMRRTPENDPENGHDQMARVNRLLEDWTADTGFALDRLAQLNAADPASKWTGRLDLGRVGVFGHSFGGATALQFCREDTRCKAAIDLDGAPFGSVVQSGLPQPVLFLMSDHGQFDDPEAREVMGHIQAIYDRLPPDGRLRLMIHGANHFLFSDDGALLKSHLLMGALRGLHVIGIDGPRQLAITTYCVRGFFDRYLKGLGVSPLVLTNPAYPELVVLNR